MQLYVSGFRYLPGKLTCDQPLIGFIQEAYSVKEWQISGPDWLPSEKYEFAATMPPSTTRETARLMLQTMLAERFGLKLHRVQRPTPVYVLLVANGGLRLQEVPTAEGSTTQSTAGQYTARAIPVEGIIHKLSQIADRPVIDMSGLKGYYNIDMHWTPDFEDSVDGRSKRDRGILGVLQEQAGLKLEKRTMPVDILVIDYVNQKPTPN
jgi:uncharacterized protein (TIGR03435 family)